MNRKSRLTIGTAAALAALSAHRLRAGKVRQVLAEVAERNRVRVTSRDTRIGQWSLPARTDEVLKVIVANPTMIKAYKAGIPGNGQPFPEGSKIAKLRVEAEEEHRGSFVVDVPDVFTQAFVIEKDSKRFPKSGGWGYALFNYDAQSGRIYG